MKKTIWASLEIFCITFGIVGFEPTPLTPKASMLSFTPYTVIKKNGL